MDETVERAQRGEHQAMGAVLAEVAPAVQRFALRLCRDVHDAEDVSQDALLAIANNLAQYDGRSSLATWAYTLARTACVRKRRGLKNQRSPDGAAVLAKLPAPEPHPEMVAELREFAAHLERALRLLPPDLRAVLVLRDLEEVDTTTASATLGISEDALKSRLSRARRALRSMLRDERGATNA